MDTARLEDLTRDELIDLIRERAEGGISLVFSGKANARRLARKVRPRVTRYQNKHSLGTPEEQSLNQLLEGDNLQAMVTLYRQRGLVDLILADPPYNTGNDWRYNDKWDEDPNDPGLGDFVSEDDGARHTKWMKFMWPRLQLMRSMLKPSGVLAICIDHRELFRLGQMLDELFGESNRLAIINWQKTTAPRSDSGHITSATEYVLVYAKDEDAATTNRLERKASSDRRYGNPDGDKGLWREGNLSARTYSRSGDFGIQSPFTGEIHYPPGNRAWAHPKRNILRWLEQWGTPFTPVDIGDGREKALIAKGGKPGIIPFEVTRRSQDKLTVGPWPFVWFGLDGLGRPRVKTYLENIKRGAVPVTYWVDEADEILELGATSWNHRESDRSSDGVEELNAIVGPGHGFDTVKPLKLFQKILQLWCPSDGLVLDPFAGSGTTGHAVLSLNIEQGASRRFILTEQGRPERGDSYARTLTADRLRRVITGDWANGKGEPLGGGFKFLTLGN